MNTYSDVTKPSIPYERHGMKAIRVYQFGGVENLLLEDVLRPEVRAGEVVIHVGAAGVGPWDAWVRSGNSALPQPLPLTPGADLSGMIVAIGAGVTDFKIGDDVYGVTNKNFTGAYAEYAVASVEMIAKRPSRLCDIDAASVPVVAVTAWQALALEAQLTRGQSVLIHGAAGNVGAYAVQFARRMGLRVFATVGPNDVAFAKSLNADHVVDYSSETFEDIVGKLDAVIDLVGGETQRRSFAVLKQGGKLVSAVSTPDQHLANLHGVDSHFFLVNVTTERLETIARMIDAGDLVPQVGTVLPLAAARTAHEMLEGKKSHPRGKIVLRIGA